MSSPSVRNVTAEMEKLVATLNLFKSGRASATTPKSPGGKSDDESDWEARKEALRRLQVIFESGADTLSQVSKIVSSAKRAHVMQALSEQFQDQRSAIVKEAGATAIIIARVVPPELMDNLSVERDLFPVLLKESCSGNRLNREVIADSCCAILRSAANPKLAQLVVDSRSKDRLSRVLCMSCCHVLCADAKPDRVQRSLPAISAAITEGLGDADSTVRDQASIAFSAYTRTYPSEAGQTAKGMDKRRQQSLAMRVDGQTPTSDGQLHGAAILGVASPSGRSPLRSRHLSKGGSGLDRQERGTTGGKKATPAAADGDTVASLAAALQRVLSSVDCSAEKGPFCAHFDQVDGLVDRLEGLCSSSSGGGGGGQKKSMNPGVAAAQAKITQMYELSLMCQQKATKRSKGPRAAEGDVASLISIVDDIVTAAAIPGPALSSSSFNGPAAASSPAVSTHGGAAAAAAAPSGYGGGSQMDEQSSSGGAGGGGAAGGEGVDGKDQDKGYLLKKAIKTVIKAQDMVAYPLRKSVKKVELAVNALRESRLFTSPAESVHMRRLGDQLGSIQSRVASSSSTSPSSSSSSADDRLSLTDLESMVSTMEALEKEYRKQKRSTNRAPAGAYPGGGPPPPAVVAQGGGVGGGGARGGGPKQGGGAKMMSEIEGASLLERSERHRKREARLKDAAPKQSVAEFFDFEWQEEEESEEEVQARRSKQKSLLGGLGGGGRGGKAAVGAHHKAGGVIGGGGGTKMLTINARIADDGSVDNGGGGGSGGSGSSDNDLAVMKSKIQSIRDKNSLLESSLKKQHNSAAIANKPAMLKPSPVKLKQHPQAALSSSDVFEDDNDDRFKIRHIYGLREYPAILKRRKAPTGLGAAGGGGDGAVAQFQSGPAAGAGRGGQGTVVEALHSLHSKGQGAPAAKAGGKTKAAIKSKVVRQRGAPGPSSGLNAGMAGGRKNSPSSFSDPGQFARQQAMAKSRIPRMANKRNLISQPIKVLRQPVHMMQAPSPQHITPNGSPSPSFNNGSPTFGQRGVPNPSLEPPMVGQSSNQNSPNMVGLDGTVGRAEEELNLLSGLSKLDDMLDGMRMKSLGSKADKVISATPPQQRVIGQQQTVSPVVSSGQGNRQQKRQAGKGAQGNNGNQRQQRGPGGGMASPPPAAVVPPHFVQMGNSPQMMPVYPMQQQMGQMNMQQQMQGGMPQHAMMQQQPPHMMQAGQGQQQFMPMMPQPQAMQQAYLHYGGPAMHSYALQPPGNFAVSPTISPTMATGGGGYAR